MTSVMKLKIHVKAITILLQKLRTWKESFHQNRLYTTAAYSDVLHFSKYRIFMKLDSFSFMMLRATFYIDLGTVITVI